VDFLFLPCRSSHVMPMWNGAVAGIYGCGFSCPFLLTGKDPRVKAKIIGQLHGRLTA